MVPQPSDDGSFYGVAAAPRLPPPPKTGHGTLPSLPHALNDPHRLYTAPTQGNNNGGGSPARWPHGGRGLVSEQQSRTAASNKVRAIQDIPSPPETSRSGRKRLVPSQPPSEAGHSLGNASARTRGRLHRNGLPSERRTKASPRSPLTSQRGFGVSQRLPTSYSAPEPAAGEPSNFRIGVGTQWDTTYNSLPEPWIEVSGADKGRSKKTRDGRFEFGVQVLSRHLMSEDCG